MRKRFLRNAMCLLLAAALLIGDAGAVMAADGKVDLKAETESSAAIAKDVAVEDVASAMNQKNESKNFSTKDSTYIGAPTGLIQTNSTETSISLSWNAGSGAVYYLIGYCAYGKDPAVATQAVALESTSTSYTLTNLEKNQKYAIVVYSYAADQITHSQYYASLAYGTVTPSVVNAIKTANFYNKTAAYIQITPKTAAKGYEYIAYTYKGKKIAQSSVTSYNGLNYVRVASASIKEGQFYKVKIRAYSTLGDSYSGVKKYSGWSSDFYFTGAPKKQTLKTSGSKKLKISWSKVSGATNYSVYISTKKNSGFQKVKTTKSRSYTIKKYKGKKLKKNKTYYVYVVANKKVGKKTYTGCTTWGRSIKAR